MDSISISPKVRFAGRYRVLEKLGEGSFAETFLAEDEHLPDSFRCVIKKLKTGVEDESKLQIAKRLFDAEAKTLHQLGSHGQIPQLLAHFEEDGEFCLVEEYVEGLSLYQELAAGQKWSEGYVIHLLRDILEALKFIHQKQVIHRDLKPSNIIRRERDGRIVLIDFGAVKQVASQALDDVNTTLNAHTVIVGTPGYMPGEQLRGSPRMSSDVYAVGMIAIYALTGLNPSLGELPEDENTAEILWHDHASVSPELAAIIDKMVAYDFRQRYATAAEALDALDALSLQRQEESPTILKDPTNLPRPAGSSTGSITFNGDSSASAGSVGPAVGSSAGSSANGFLPTVMAPSRSQEPVFNGLEATSVSHSVSQDIPSHQGTYAVANVNNSFVRAGSEVRADSEIALPRSRGVNFKMLAAGGAAVLALGTIAALAAPNIEPICRALNNCTAEVRFRSAYKEAVSDAEAAEAAGQGAKSLGELQTAQGNLQNAVQQLAKIPEGVGSHKDASVALSGFQAQLKALDQKIAIEKRAQKDLTQADAIANKVLSQKKAPQTSAGLLENKAQLQKAIAQANKVPAQSLMAAQAQAKKQTYQQKIKTLDTEISAVRKKEEEAAAAAEAERQRQAAAARAYTPPPASSGSGSSPQYSDPPPSSSGGGGNWDSPGGGSQSAAADPPPRQSGGGGGGGGQPAPAQEPLWGNGSGGGSGSSGGSAPASGGSQEPLW